MAANHQEPEEGDESEPSSQPQNEPASLRLDLRLPIFKPQDSTSLLFKQRPLTFRAPRTGFMEDNFPVVGGWGWAWLWDDSSALRLWCTLFLYYDIGSTSGNRSQPSFQRFLSLLAWVLHYCSLSDLMSRNAGSSEEGTFSWRVRGKNALSRRTCRW